MIKDKEIHLSDNVVENIQKMAPYLTKKQQHIAFGLLLGLMSDNEKEKDPPPKKSA